jgi:hypothetical protein
MVMRNAFYSVDGEGTACRAWTFQYEQGLVAVVAEAQNEAGWRAEVQQVVRDAVGLAGWQADSKPWFELLTRLSRALPPESFSAAIVAVGEDGFHGATLGEARARWLSHGRFAGIGTRVTWQEPGGRKVPMAIIDFGDRGAGKLVLATHALWGSVPVELIQARLSAEPIEASWALAHAVRVLTREDPQHVGVVVVRLDAADSRDARTRVLRIRRRSGQCPSCGRRSRRGELQARARW